MNCYRTGATPFEQGHWTDNQRDEIKGLVGAALDHAEGIWRDVKHEFKSTDLLEARSTMVKYASTMGSALPTLIPAHEVLDPRFPQVSEFTAFVLDIRDSTKHLTTYLGPQKVQKLERVLYETFGVLPACSRALEYHSGSTTEYLGDGILGLFHAPEEQVQTRDDALMDATRAGWKCLDIRHWVNSELSQRYQLPPIDIGIGISWSKAIVTVIGHSEKNAHAKVMGECVFKASKMAGGRNQMHTDKSTESIWPTVKKGRKAGVTFRSRSVRGLDGFLIERVK